MTQGAGLRARWRARPAIYSPGLWTLMLALDLLPWPWGEDILARLFVVVGVLRPRRWRRAVAWASAQPGHRPWRLAAALCASRGRWCARAGLLGVRSPDALRRHLIVHGEEHLTGVPDGAILLGFHLGPANADLTLRLRGHRVAWLGWAQRLHLGWLRRAWRPLAESSEFLHPTGDWQKWPGILYRARRILREGGNVYVTADGGGKAVFRLSLPGGRATVRAGWLILHRLTGARVLPVLTHLEGRTQVVVIHPPLPLSGPDGATGLEASRAVLTPLLEDYVRRFPEQCPSYAFTFNAPGWDEASSPRMPPSRAHGLDRAEVGADRHDPRQLE